jgi:hypothetical protein
MSMTSSKDQGRCGHSTHIFPNLKGNFKMAVGACGEIKLPIKAH